MRQEQVSDKMLVCRDCGSEFVFSKGEQLFFREKGFEKEPVRCPACRKARKQEKTGQKGR
jgi:ssDNA-binding Zn-finger/Zn-ribbon topoisomerase 1